ncbi:MAG: zinc ABC transporter permease [Flavobacteriales bacterium]|nr:zinc ABC transporter permease [Flavobacteriales bacterium]|tara:strand:- start:1191 stop:2453 length:1263 start_codon:yes stop_codon:yes gene_type:complete
MDPVFLKVLVGTTLLAASSSVVGAFSYLKGQSLVGDAIAHALLPGVVLAFILGGVRSPSLLIFGALISGLLAHYGIGYIANKTKLKSDTAVSLVLSTFFGFGIMLMSYIQRTGQGQQAGLERFLLGKAAAITMQDVYVFSTLAIVLIIGVSLFYKGFQLMTFNEDFAHAIGLPMPLIRFTFTVLTVLAITIGIQTVGVVLMAALLITPSAAARVWTNSLPTMLALAAFFAGISAVFGTYISSLIPKMPTGPWVVLILSFFGFSSLLFAPKKGWFSKRRRARINQRKTIRENVLKLLFQQEEQNGMPSVLSVVEILRIRAMPSDSLTTTIKGLKKRMLIVDYGDRYALTELGRSEGRRVVRLHRLWELYLTERLGMAADHIHPQAETMEHVITPEIEELLVKELGNPEVDPHQSPIPYEED